MRFSEIATRTDAEVRVKLAREIRRQAEEIAEHFRAAGISVTLSDAAGEIEIIDEAEPIKPLTTRQAAARAVKLRRAADWIADIRALNAIKLRAPQKRLSDL